MSRGGAVRAVTGLAALTLLIGACGSGDDGGDTGQEDAQAPGVGSVLEPEVTVDERTVPDDVCDFLGLEEAELEQAVDSELTFSPRDQPDPASGSCNWGAAARAGTTYNVNSRVDLIAADENALGTTLEERIDFWRGAGYEEQPIPDDVRAVVGDDAVLLATIGETASTVLVFPVDDDHIAEIGLGSVSRNDRSFEQDIVPLTLELVPLVDVLQD